MPIPFGLANALFAVTEVNFKIYILASVVGLIPSQLILCYMGSTLKSMSDVLANEKTAQTAYFVFVVQLIIAVVVLYYILNLAKQELEKHLNKNPGCCTINSDLDHVITEDKEALIKAESIQSVNTSNEKCQILCLTVQK
jgi:hypothetical protein